MNDKTSDRKVEELMKKIHGHAKGKQLLKQMDTTLNRPKDGECFTCSKMDIIKPFTLDCCKKCVYKYAIKKGKVYIHEKKDNRLEVPKYITTGHGISPLTPRFVPNPFNTCPVCGGSSKVHYTIHSELCFKCINKFGKKAKDFNHKTTSAG